MALYLVQHGISAAKEVDPERGLTARGREETQRIAAVARGYGIGVAKIVHSGKKRAEQTAAIMHEALAIAAPPVVVAGLDPLDDVRRFASGLEPGAGLMVVGHLPFLQRLVSWLTTGSEELKVYQFQNSGIVCLDAETDTDGRLDWFIKWTLNPTISLGRGVGPGRRSPPPLTPPGRGGGR